MPLMTLFWLSPLAAEPPTLADLFARWDGPPAPVRAITRGPKHHWFGYYDKLQFDPAGRYVLGMEVDFEGRTPTADDVVGIGMVDLAGGDRWIELGESRAWGWQQGCMLQWRPGSDREVIWNDRVDGRFVAWLLDVRSGERRMLPRPVYHLSPDGRWAVGLDFARLQVLRPGYGYVGVDSPTIAERAPDGSGIYRLDLETGESTEVVSLATIAAIPYPDSDPADRHWFNHLEWSPDGRRFIFLNRWSRPGMRGFGTRMFTAAADGSDVRLVTDAPGISHFIWRDARQISIWRGDYLLYRDDGSGESELLWRAPNGHQSYLPDLDWLISDTYPQGPAREQWLHLYHLPTARIVPLGRFASPPEYTGEWRCDLHPRLSPDAGWATIDSTHGGDGRQLYLVDLRAARR